MPGGDAEIDGGDFESWVAPPGAARRGDNPVQHEDLKTVKSALL